MSHKGYRSHRLWLEAISGEKREVKPKVLKRTASGSNLDQLLYGSAIPTRTSSSFVFTLSHTEEGSVEPEILYGSALTSIATTVYFRTLP